jgi:hypothetical protein
MLRHAKKEFLMDLFFSCLISNLFLILLLAQALCNLCGGDALHGVPGI